MANKFVLNQEDGTVEGGDIRGNHAVDLQMVRSLSTQVATGSRSIILNGERNRTTGANSIVGGYQNLASGQNSVALGFNNSASGLNSFATNSSNSVSRSHGFVAGFTNNIGATGDSSSITGGSQNVVQTDKAHIGGGLSNSINYTGTNGYEVISGGRSNTASTSYATISGGQDNTVSTSTHATVVGGYQNSSTGQYSISGGYSNVASGQGSVAMGYDNTASDNYAIAFGHQNNASGGGYSAMAFGRFNQSTSRRTIAMGQNNIASDENAISLGLNNQATKRTTIAVGSDNNASNDGAIAIGSINIASGSYSVAMGASNTATANYSVAFGYDNDANEVSTFVSGARAKAYLRGQRSHAPNRDLAVAGVGQAQMSELIAIRTDTLTTGATTTLSLDGTGTTNLVIPDGTNRGWNVTIKSIATVTAIAGTATGVNVGDMFIQDDKILFKKVSNTSSIVNSSNSQTIFDTSMSTALMSYSVGGSQDLQIDFISPSFTGGGSVTYRVVSKIELVEVAF